MTNFNDSTVLIDQAIEDRYFRACFAYPKLLAVTVDQLQENNFSTPQKSRLFAVLKTYFETFGDVPTLDILKITAEELFPSEQAILVIRLADRIYSQIEVPEWKWIVSKIDTYVKTIKLRKSLFEAAAILDKGSFDEAQARIVDTIRHSGLVTGATVDALEMTREELFKLSQDDDIFCCPTRIYALDEVIRGFYRKELFVLLAPLNVGKSFFVVHSAVSALMSGKHVLYFTLEMSREKALQRIVQNISGTTKPRYNDELTRIVKDWDEGWSERNVEREARTLLDTAKTHKALQTLRRFGGHLHIAEYASGDASVKDLIRDIELFDVHFGKLPDIVLVDGLPDMRLGSSKDSDARRIGLTQLAKDLRKIGRDYNCAVVATHQANREGLSAEVVGVEHSGESLGILQVADTGLSLNQTRAENSLGKLRINVMRARGAQKWQMIDVWQHLDMAQFCLVSKEIDAPRETEKPQGGRTRVRRQEG